MTAPCSFCDCESLRTARPRATACTLVAACALASSEKGTSATSERVLGPFPIDGALDHVSKKT